MLTLFIFVGEGGHEDTDKEQKYFFVVKELVQSSIPVDYQGAVTYSANT